MFSKRVSTQIEKRMQRVLIVAAAAFGLSFISLLMPEEKPHSIEYSGQPPHMVAGVVYPIQSMNVSDASGMIRFVLDGYDADGLGGYFVEQRSPNEVQEVDDSVIPPGTAKLSMPEWYARHVVLFNPKGMQPRTHLVAS